MAKKRKNEGGRLGGTQPAGAAQNPTGDEHFNGTVQVTRYQWKPYEFSDYKHRQQKDNPKKGE